MKRVEAGQVWEGTPKARARARTGPEVRLWLTIEPDANQGCWVVVDLETGEQGVVGMPDSMFFKVRLRTACR